MSSYMFFFKHISCKSCLFKSKLSKLHFFFPRYSFHKLWYPYSQSFSFAVQQDLQYSSSLSLRLHLSLGDCTSLSLPSLTVSSLSWSMIMNITPPFPFVFVSIFIRIKIKHEAVWRLSRNLLLKHTPTQTWTTFWGFAVCQKPESPFMYSAFYVVVS